MATNNKTLAATILVTALGAGHVSGRLAVPTQPTSARVLQIRFAEDTPAKPGGIGIDVVVQKGSARDVVVINCDADGSSPRLGGQTSSDEQAKDLCVQAAQIRAAIIAKSSQMADVLAEWQEKNTQPGHK